MTSTLGNDVCVVGTGMIGLLAIKNLREQGLNPTAFTKDDDHVGGMWRVSGNMDKTTAMVGTRAHSSRQSNCFTDFPMPDSFDLHPTSGQFDEYLNSYAKHFNLHPLIRFSTAVTGVRRNDSDTKWLVTTEHMHTGKTETHTFSRVVMASGILNTPKQPSLEGQERFQGEIIHSRRFKNPDAYKGKNVLVVGIGETGSDTLCFLRKAGAGKLYSSHRGSYWVLPRMADNGKSFDHNLSRRVAYMVRFIASCSATLCAWLMGKGLASMQAKAFPFLKDHPAFAPDREAPTLFTRAPMFSTALPEYLRDGSIEDLRGVQRITGPRSVRLTDGRDIDDLDAIIVCTGYEYDMSFLQGKGDPTDPALAPDGYRALTSAPFYPGDKKFPRLYRGYASEQYPESLAILGHFIMMKPLFALYDLTTMALASVWSGSYPVPTAPEMRSDIDRHYNFVVKTLQSSPLFHWGFRIDARDTYIWLNRAAGTGIMERLGSWSWTGWKFWLTENKLHKLLMDGVDVPAVYRLFDTGRGRKPWAGALKQIEKVNEEVEEMGKQWEREQKKLKQV